ncbi:MAG: hypothetical protein AB9919_13075 [Geobacteraceae bacterium]
MAELSKEARLANYMIGRYRLGYGFLALYLAAVLFEHIINQKSEVQLKRLNKNAPNSNEEDTLTRKICALDDKTINEDSVLRYRDIFGVFKDKDDNVKNITSRYGAIGKLLNFKKVRNDVAHEIDLDYVVSNKSLVEEMMIYVWSELSPISFTSVYEKSKANPGGEIIGTLFETTADYMIRAVDETMTKGEPQPFKGITRSNFENMYDLRRSLASLQVLLREWLAVNADFLCTDILTTIDTTSGYIWLPLATRKNDLGKIRLGIRGCSVSILATPLDLRIYLEFGGWAKEDRKSYYRFLGSAAYEEFHREMVNNGDFLVFDIDWYSALFNVRPFASWITNRYSDIEIALQKLEKATGPITWNRMLHGYVISRDDLVDGKMIDFRAIEPKLRDIIALYKAFSKFNKHNEKEN